MWGEKVFGYVADQKYNLDIDTAEEWRIAEVRMEEILREEKAG
jgi:CMP-N-acetylneuraminic acid synthetase